MLHQLTMNFDPLNKPDNRTFNQQSKEAEESVKETKEATFEKILKVYKENESGLTSEECSILAEISYESAHKRVADLVKSRKLYNTGLTRKNKSGRMAEVRKYSNYPNA